MTSSDRILRQKKIFLNGLLPAGTISLGIFFEDNDYVWHDVGKISEILIKVVLTKIEGNALGMVMPITITDNYR